MDDLTPTPQRDPQLAALLRAAEPEPPLEAVDWAAMRARLSQRAELPLAARRAEARTRTAVRRPRWLVPLAAAASVAVAVLAGRAAMAPAPADPGAVAVDSSRAHPAVDVLVDGAVAEQVDDLISGQADADALLLAAVGTVDS